MKIMPPLQEYFAARRGHKEDFSRRVESKGPSDRSFGLMFATVFALIGSWPILSQEGVRLWALLASGVFLVFTLAAPRLLAVPNRLWTKFGLFLGNLVNPVVMAILFYAIITPYGLIIRWLRKDPLRLRFDRSADSYWLDRIPPGPEPQSMKDQF